MLLTLIFAGAFEYELTYPNQPVRTYAPLVAFADEVYAGVAEIFGQRLDHPLPIVLESDEEQSLQHQASRLAHQTAHAFLAELTAQRPLPRFIEEGFAHYASLRGFRDDRWLHFNAGFAYAHGAPGLAQLAAVPGGGAADTIVYDACGLVFIEAIVGVHGEAALGRWVKALANPALPWEAALSVAEINLARVLVRYDALLADAYAANRKAIDSSPKLSATVVADGDALYVMLDEPLPPRLRLACRFRGASGDLADRWPRENRACPVPPGTREYQLFVGEQEDGWRMESPWAPIRRDGAPAFQMRKFERALERGCASGDEAACVALAIDANIENQPMRAGFFHEKACAAGDAASCVLAGRGHVSRDEHAEARAAFARACARGDGEGCFELGRCYYEGTCAEEDFGRAAKHFVAACELGDATGCYFLASCHWSGDGVRKDDERARELYRLACDRGSGGACESLGSLLEDDADTAKLYALACRLDAATCASHARFSAPEKQHIFFTRACDAGDEDACAEAAARHHH